ncbi:hypothetical protein C6P44_001281 [Monosporozyma unispora]|nr:hypothetical protein C6P44_001281 [Kazachstania unispora]
MLSNIITYLSLFLLTQAATVADISFSNLSLKPSGPYNPILFWVATFDFDIADTSSIAKGDTFSVDLNNVYRVKFDNDNPTMDINLSDGTTAFTCHVEQQGAYKFDDSILTCVADEDLSSYNSISGEISFSFSFNDGGSTQYSSELNGAKAFSSGTQQVSLNNDLSAPANFEATTFSGDSYSFARTTTYNSMESYYLDMSCPSGYIVGGKQTINYDYQNGGFALDCSSVEVGTSSKFNDFLFPLEASATSPDYYCSDNEVTITVGESDPGAMLYVNALQSIHDNSNVIVHRVDVAYTCMDTKASTTYSTSFAIRDTFTVVQGQNYATASPSTTPSRLDATITTTTTTETPSTSSVPATSSAPVVIITTTTTTGWTGSFTTTYSTETTVTTNSSGSTTPEIVIHVETPSTASVPITTSTSKVTIPSTPVTSSAVPVTSTISSEIISSVPIPSSTIVSSNPITTITTTTTTGWTGSITTTYTTETTVVTHSSGFTTPEIVVHVETPSTSSVPATSSNIILTVTTELTLKKSSTTTNALVSTRVTHISSSAATQTKTKTISTTPVTNEVTPSSSTSKTTPSVPITPVSESTFTETQPPKSPEVPKSNTKSTTTTETVSSTTSVTSLVPTVAQQTSTTVTSESGSVTPRYSHTNTVSSKRVPHTPLILQVTSLSTQPSILIFNGLGNSMKPTGFTSAILALLSLFLL